MTQPNRNQPRAGSLLAIPTNLRPESFLAPPGTHLATLRRVAFLDRADGTARRLIFQIAAPASAHVVYLVGKTYPPGADHELQQDLVAWLGSDLQSLVDPSGQIDLTRLEGLTARITVSLYRSEGYTEDFRSLDSIRPATPDRIERASVTRTPTEDAQ